MGGEAQSRARPTRRWRAAGVRIVKLVLLAYGVWLLAAFMLQRAFIFPRPSLDGTELNAADVPGVTLVRLKGTDGAPIVAWFCVGDGCSEASPGACVVFAHGNAELIQHNASVAEMYREMGVSTLMVEYRGYGGVPGSPSQERIVSDFRVARRWLVGRPDVNPGQIIYHGRSLGGGVLAALAATDPPSGVIVESTFTSMRAMLARYLVPGFLCRDPFETARVLPSLGVPVLIVHGSKDVVVPVAHGRRLARLVPGATYLEFACGHNDLPPDRPAYEGSVRTLVDRVRASGLRERPR